VRRTSALPANIKEQTSFIHGFCAWGPRAKYFAHHHPLHHNRERKEKSSLRARLSACYSRRLSLDL
jgi:hypothetical protein